MSLNETVPQHIDPDYYYQSKQPLVSGVCALLITVTVLTISLRFYSRWVSKLGFWWDDWFALATVPFCLLPPIVDWMQLRLGLGRHPIVIANTDPGYLQAYAFRTWVLLLLYNPGLALFKYALLAFYVRVFAVVTWMRWAVIALATLITLWILATEFLLVFRCDPIRAAWTPDVGTCAFDMRRWTLFQSIPTVIFDVAILLLPLQPVWRLQHMSRHSRVGITAVFMLGGLVTVISVVRLWSTLTSHIRDVTWGIVELNLWSAAEPVTGLLSSCLLTYCPLLRATGHKLHLITSGGTHDRAGRSIGGLHHPHLSGIPTDTSQMTYACAGVRPDSRGTINVAFAGRFSDVRSDADTLAAVESRSKTSGDDEAEQARNLDRLQALLGSARVK